MWQPDAARWVTTDEAIYILANMAPPLHKTAATKPRESDLSDEQDPDLQAKIAAIRAQLASTTKPRESDLSDEQDPDHTNPHGDPANAPSPPKNHA